MVTNTLVVEGNEEGQVEELASFYDSLGGDDLLATVQATQDVQSGIRLLTEKSSILSNADEKSYEPAYNLLINLLRSSPSLPEVFPKLLSNLSQPPSFPNGPNANLAILSTLFNILEATSPLRFQVFTTILQFCREHGFFENLEPSLKSLPSWLQDWGVSAEERRKLYTQIIQTAEEHEDIQSVDLLLRLLKSFDLSELDAAKTYALKAINYAIADPSYLQFDDLYNVPAIRSLEASNDPAFELLDVFATKEYKDFTKFLSDHSDWTKDNIDVRTAISKIRLLTLATLANRSSSRKLTYDEIVEAIDVPKEDVEMWIIDVIRAGVIEGKLSQLDQVVLIHRSSHRTFERPQWQEVRTRLQRWEQSLQEVLTVLEKQRENTRASLQDRGELNHIAEKAF